jgi:uncharacterized protein YbbK (DUF523 family)
MRSCEPPHSEAEARRTMTARILVSACLLGRPVRYNGSARTLIHPTLEVWRAEGRLVSLCPELAGGFATPRPPAEIEGGRSGLDVLSGRARVIESTGADVTSLYIRGAEAALALARSNGCVLALLVDGSPSCGSGFIHDGGFAGRKQLGAGVTTALLRDNGIAVFAEFEIDALQARLNQLG